ncbi:MAG: hypothetical protein HRF48_00250 [Chloroflexota bacterium]|jgi:hypothetical protein
MTKTLHHPIRYGAPLNSPQINTRLSQLDSAIARCLAGEEQFSAALFVNNGAAPGTPAAAHLRLYALSGQMVSKDSDGVQHSLNEVTGGKLKVRTAADQTISSITTVQFNDPVVDTLGEWDAATFAWKPKKAGFYEVLAVLNMITTVSSVQPQGYAIRNTLATIVGNSHRGPLTPNVLTTLIVRGQAEVSTPNADLLLIQAGAGANSFTLKAGSYFIGTFIP